LESFNEDGATSSGQHDAIDSSLNRELKLVNRGELLGEGTFGKVYQGHYNGFNSRIPPRMAIKVVYTKDKILLRKLLHECELLKTLNHPHIVKYYGCVMNED
jgi:serine/threonine protein kinase